MFDETSKYKSDTKAILPFRFLPTFRKNAHTCFHRHSIDDDHTHLDQLVCRNSEYDKVVLHLTI